MEDAYDGDKTHAGRKVYSQETLSSMKPPFTQQPTPMHPRQQQTKKEAQQRRRDNHMAAQLRIMKKSLSALKISLQPPTKYTLQVGQNTDIRHFYTSYGSKQQGAPIQLLILRTQPAQVHTEQSEPEATLGGFEGVQTSQREVFLSQKPAEVASGSGSLVHVSSSNPKGTLGGLCRVATSSKEVAHGRIPPEVPSGFGLLAKRAPTSPLQGSLQCKKQRQSSPKTPTSQSLLTHFTHKLTPR